MSEFDLPSRNSTFRLGIACSVLGLDFLYCKVTPGVRIQIAFSEIDFEQELHWLLEVPTPASEFGCVHPNFDLTCGNEPDGCAHQ